MANIDLGWEVKGSIEADESVSGMLKVIEQKDETGSFWCWDGRVSLLPISLPSRKMDHI